ncbi:MAG: SGNH/GDSL hydrolase family protein [Lentimonas sp.]
MKHLISHLLLILCIPLCLWSAEPFKANDRVAFVGDSITHGGDYHTHIQAFYATRFPDRNVICFNVGISGDNAQGGYQRASAKGDGIWGSDVRMYQPTAATIMLGMNDVGGGQFSSSETREALDNSNQQQLDWYANNYSQLLDNLETLGLSEITLIKSTPYDQTMVNEKASDNLYKFGIGKNDAILAVSEQVIDVEAKKRGYSVVDFNAPMLAINADQQAIDPSFTIISNDRVHPRGRGHMVMAYTFLKAQDLAGPVAQVVINAESESVESTQNCSINNLQNNGTLSFDYAAKSLPFPTKPYKDVAALIPFEAEFNQESLIVKNLRAGSYTLEIDGIECGRFTAAELDSGVNLALLDNAPQVLQAKEVYALCQERAKLSRTIRTIVWAIGYLSKIKGHDANDAVANQAMVERLLEGEHLEGLWEAPSRYVQSNLRQYAEHYQQYEALLMELDALTEPLYRAAQSKTHRVQIKAL